MQNFQERVMPLRDRALHAAAVRVGLELVARDGLDGATLTELARRLRLPGEERVSERTLRRKYGNTARLLFGTPWWLPEPADAVRAVLAPRPRRTEGPVWPSGPEADSASAVVDDCRCENGIPARDPRGRPAWCACEDGRTDDTWPDAAFFTDAGLDDPLGDLARTSPEPIALRDLLHDLHVVLTGHLVATGWAANLPWILDLREERPEVAAWLALAEATWAESLGRTIARVFDLDATGGAAAAAAFGAVARELAPLVGELGAAHHRAARGARPVAAATSAETDLGAARARAFDVLGTVVSVPDRIGESRGRSTVVPGGMYATLPNRARRPGATG
ncbi:hypothetical protein [Tsukamurella paurometabola]|uniref:Uncharacterized protein n=1 Tax=Tsukamurella paurometabola TaxID=2061 RepID=A0A3P8JXC1_TSUPA|nr:hypothetical protein [Tsukamurella paurometabola]UEA84883.1 hypothetical protein LK411_08735 [Tsukamurella paurometabola]VDR37474.1 Uncharacterised protein [Tsukamurella paurometabola]